MLLASSMITFGLHEIIIVLRLSQRITDNLNSAHFADKPAAHEFSDPLPFSTAAAAIA